MEINLASVKLVDPTRPLEIVPLGDMHIGSANCDKAYLQKTIDWIKSNPNARWIGMGDYADYISANDPRYSEGGLDPDLLTGGFNVETLLEKEYTLLVKLLEPIADKCLGLHSGNHELSILKHNYWDLTRKLANTLKVPYLGFSALTQLHWNRNQFHRDDLLIYSTHGSSNSVTDGSKLTALLKMADRIPQANIFLMGHCHSKIAADDTIPKICNGKLKFTKRLFAMTGTFLRTYKQGYLSYGEEKGYKPTKTGVIRLRIYPTKTPVDYHASV